jgi:hypothetical protein
MTVKADRNIEDRKIVDHFVCAGYQLPTCPSRTHRHKIDSMETSPPDAQLAAAILFRVFFTKRPNHALPDSTLRIRTEN